MTELLNWDTELFLWLNRWGTKDWDPFWLWVSETEIWIPLYLLLLVLLYRARDKRAFWFSLLVIALNVVFTDSGSVWLFKEQFQRLRPCHVADLAGRMRQVKEGCGGQYGFISSHASNTFGLAILLGLLMRPAFRYAWAYLLGWAVLVSYSRIYLGVHYPLDILGGAVYGMFCAWISYRIFLLINTRYNPR